MSDLVVCPACHAEAPPVAWCETCGETWSIDAPLTAASVRSTVERFLTEKGFTRRKYVGAVRWTHADVDGLLLTLTEALDVALRNEGETQ